MIVNKFMRALLIISILSVLAFPAFAGRPSASVTCESLVDSYCMPQLESLCEATEDADSLKNRDRNGLVGKVLNTSVKLSQDKVDDATDKLDGYDRKLNALNDDANKPKISNDDFMVLLGKLLAAQVCVGGL
jgi:hypothetical protein